MQIKVVFDKLLPCGPNSTSSIDRLYLDTHIVVNDASTSRSNKVINAAPGNLNFRQHVQLIARYMILQKMDSIDEDLSTLKKSNGAYYDGVSFEANCAGANGDVRIALAYLDTSSTNVATVLTL